MAAPSDRLKQLSSTVSLLHQSKNLEEIRKGTMTDYKFYGWVAKDKNSVGNLTWEEYQPKTWTEDDVDIKITHCGICSSDLHTLRSGWGPTNYPAVVGHEIVGLAVKVGKNVKGIKVGDRVGVGAQSGSCLECEQCKESREPYCDNGQIGTYNGVYPDGSKSYGGYADYSRVPSHFVVKIPDSISSEIAAPMLCGGVTVYSPIKDHGAGPGKTVGIVGIGGLGHFGLIFAKAFGAEVVAISHSPSKEADAKKMGASRFIATSKGKQVFEENKRTMDFIVCTVNTHDMPILGYLNMLKVGGKLIMVGAPEEPLPQIPVFPFILNNVYIGGSAIGSPETIQEMLELAAKQDLKGWIQTRPMKDCNAAVLDMEDGKARYRYCLVNEKNLSEIK